MSDKSDLKMTTSTKKENIVKENLKQLVAILKMALPKGRYEIVCFLVFFAVYFSYSLLFLYTTSIIDRIPSYADMYLYYDNTEFFHKGYNNIAAHPLMPFFMEPFLWIGEMLISLIGYKAKGVFFVFLTSAMTALSVLYINRYLRLIVELKGFALWLLTLLFACFSTTLVLCFTTESYTIVAYFLTLSVFFYSYYISRQKKVRLASNIFFATMLGGVTITNFAQGLIPMFFTKEGWKQRVYRMAFVSAFFGICLLFIELRFHVVENMFGYYEHYSPSVKMYASGQFYRLAIDHFWGSPMLFPETIGDYVLITFGLYNYWWHYAFAVPLAVLVLIAVVRNWRNVYVQMLALLFAFNVFLHVVLRFGIHEAYLYGAHWIYVVPLLLGWLVASVKGWIKYAVLAIISFIFVIMFLNNVSWMIDFWQYMRLAFPPMESL